MDANDIFGVCKYTSLMVVNDHSFDDSNLHLLGDEKSFLCGWKNPSLIASKIFLFGLAKLFLEYSTIVVDAKVFFGGWKGLIWSFRKP